jgi:hypothetical protein
MVLIVHGKHYLKRRNKMKIKVNSLLKEMGMFYCFCKSPLTIQKYWGQKLIYIGSAALYIIVDLRKNWIKDMITGTVE